MRVSFADDLKAPCVIDFLLGPRLLVPDTDYPDFKDWLERSESEVASGSKRHMACWWNFELVGLVIWQRHKQSPNWLEIKNLTVRPIVNGRLVGSFLLRQAEIEGKAEYNSEVAVCDAKQANQAVTSFLTARHYHALGTTHLYNPKFGKDLIFMRQL